MPEIVFEKTQAAAQEDRLSKWHLIEAIAADAVTNGLAITSGDSCVAAKAALDAVGHEHTDGTIKNLATLAKFDHESTPSQRRIWRRYGWSAVSYVANAGWKPDDAVELLGDKKRKTEKEIRQQLRGPDHGAMAERPLPERWAAWLTRANTLFTDGAKLEAETQDANVESLGAHADFGRVLYQLFTEKKLDAEIRQFFESAEVR